jgi:excisionase family DNA binding protein
LPFSGTDSAEDTRSSGILVMGSVRLLAKAPSGKAGVRSNLCAAEEDLKEFLTIDEVSEYLGIKKSSLYTKVERREIPYYKVGRLVRFKKSDIDPWMEKFKSEPLDLDAKARGILKGMGKQRTDIDALVNRSIAEAKGINYTRSQGKSDRIRGLRKEVDHGSL